MISQHLLVLQNRFACEASATVYAQYSVVEFRHKVNELCRTQLDDGSWPDCDISLAEQDGLVIGDFLQRLLILSCDCYRHRHATSLNAVVKGLELWYQKPRKNWNWWWNDIGRQRWLGPIALLLGDTLPLLLKNHIGFDMPTEPKMTGANLSDYCHGVAMGALLTGNEAQLSKALAGMSETIAITCDEGIQADYSYQQHGPQIYNGGYGESFFNGVLLWAYIADSTPFAFGAAQLRLLLDYYLNGTMWMSRHGTWDYNVCGRAIAKPQLEKPFAYLLLQQQAKYLIQLFPHHSALLSAFVLHSGDEPHPYLGFKQFWRSDYAVKVAPNYSLSIKTNSCRTKPIETGNQENLLGFWLGFGSMNLSRTGQEYRDIYPLWDWSKIPGVTCPEVSMATVDWGQIEQETHWAGGVSNSRVGITTFELDCQDTQALKSWFMFDDVVVALGAGITSTHVKPVHTCVNQCHLKSKIVADGKRVSARHPLTQPATWLHHDGVGYVFDGKTQLVLSHESRVGNWRAINGNLDQTEQGEVFQLSIEHGLSPQNQNYQYCILPDVTAVQTNNWVKNSDLNVVVNNALQQVVIYKQQLAAVFYQPGIVTLPQGGHLLVDKSCVLLVDLQEAQPMLHLATPGKAHAQLLFSLFYQGNQFSHQLTTAEETGALGQTVSVALMRRRLAINS